MNLARMRFLLAGALLAAPLAAQTVEGPVIDLPAITVTNSRLVPPPESWHYAALPGLEVLSSVSAASSQRIIRDFLTFRQCLAIVWPALGPNANVPTVLIICGAGRFDAFRAVGSESADPFQSLCLGDQGQNIIIIHGEGGAPGAYSATKGSAPSAEGELQVLAANHLDPTGQAHGLPGIPAQLAAPGLVLVAPGSGADGPEVVRNDAATRLHRDYVQFLIERIRPRPPAWLEEGLAQLLMSMQYTGKEIDFAKIESNEGTARVAQPAVNPDGAQHGSPRLYTGRSAPTGAQLGMRHAPAPPVEDQNFNFRLLESRLLPLDRMFATGYHSTEVATGITSEWAAQCAAFVDLGLYGDREKYQKGFLAFVDRSAHEPVTEEMFRQCFGLSYRQMMFALAAHVDMTAATTFEFRPSLRQGFHEFPPPPAFALREASEAEIGRIKGSALLLAGQPDFAHLTLVAPYLRGARDPQLLAALGLDELGRQQPDRARKFLEAAVAGHAGGARVYLELGRLRYAEAQAHPAAAGGLLSAGQLSAILEPLFEGRSQPFASSQVYELIAEAWSHAAVAPSAGNLAVIDEGVLRFPHDANLAYDDATLKLKRGEYADVRALIGLGLKATPLPADRGRFLALQESLPGSSPH